MVGTAPAHGTPNPMHSQHGPGAGSQAAALGLDQTLLFCACGGVVAVWVIQECYGAAAAGAGSHDELCRAAPAGTARAPAPQPRWGTVRPLRLVPEGGFVGCVEAIAYHGAEQLLAVAAGADISVWDLGDVRELYRCGLGQQPMLGFPVVCIMAWHATHFRCVKTRSHL